MKRLNVHIRPKWIPRLSAKIFSPVGVDAAFNVALE